MTDITDSPEQALAVNAPINDDMLVVAGAGSGKTYTMTRRIIALIERGVAPQSILGLTFTRKAASELLGRVSQAVMSQPTQAGAGSGASFEAMNRAFLKPEVLTYDAFFQSVVRQYGLLVGFDQDTQPLSEAGAYQLAANVVDEHMELLSGQDFGAFTTVVNAVLALSNAISGAMIGEGCTGVGEATERIRIWDAGFAEQLNKAIGDESMPESEPAPKMRKRTKKESDTHYQQRLEEYETELRRLCIYRCGQLRQVVAQRETLLTLVQEYHAAKRRLNMAEFNDFTVAAFQLVTRFPSIGERYRRRYGHVLLDEYQDTSTTQAALLAAMFHPAQFHPAQSHLTPSHIQDDNSRGESVRMDAGAFADNAGVGNADATSADARNSDIGSASTRDTGGSAVGAVGDPFQSIYAWRGASPGAFRIFQRDFELGESSRPYALSVTRRNARIVLEAANNLTAPLRAAGRQQRPSSSLMHEVDVDRLQAMDNAPTGTLGVLGYETLGQEIDAVARFALASIARHSGHGDGLDSAGTDAPSSSAGNGPHVAVLFRTKSLMPQFAQSLEKAGLTVQIVGYSALLERPEVRDLLALLHVVADHTDSASLMRLLATPRYALSTHELQALADAAERRNTEFRFRALVQAGVASADLPQEQWAQCVSEHRDEVPNAVFLGDVLVDPDLPQQLERMPSLTPRSRQTIARAGAAIRQVHRVLNHPLAEVVRTAVEALDLDIDAVVAQALAYPDKPVSPSVARAPMDAVVQLIDTYTQEIAEGQRATLRGFVSWVDALAAIQDQTAAAPDESADVVLMTIHQAKGLEWDSVAVVGLAERTFPSSQGDNLSISLDEEHPGGMQGGAWVAPQYAQTANTWLTDPAAVPVPIRADAGILPRFPHDAQQGADPIEVLRSLDDVEQIDDEIFGDMRAAAPLNEGVGEEDREAWYLTQREEYGRRLHADERRLAYVALTRAREEVLLTYSATNETGREPEEAKGRRAKPSNFWVEVRDSLCHHEDIAKPQTDSDQAAERSLAATEAVLPEGFFAGEHAQWYQRLVVSEAWQSELADDEDPEGLPWPSAMSENVSSALRLSADAVRTALARRRNPASDLPVPQQSQTTSAHRTMPYLAKASADSTLPPAQSLLFRAQLLVEDEDLMPWTAGGDGTSTRTLNDVVRERGKRILANRRQNVTALQARSGSMNAREEQRFWRALVRPIPQVASPAAQSGTMLHAWAERFVNAFGRDDVPDNAWDADTNTIAAETSSQTRAQMLEELSIVERRVERGASDAKQRRIALWERRLADSRWARRRPAWAERQIVVALPQLGDQIVVGKLDAVFFGGLDEQSDTANEQHGRADQHGGQYGRDSHDEPKRFTIVDWKTGAKPRTAEDAERKLRQLDMYRLLLSAIEDVPLASIDATLYYLDEPEEGSRELHARAKTEQEILAELSSGIPQQSDND
ncbi:ATP-dependent DNA helicase [Bifidobacterium tibiigranuli]|uniref:ATP-dependent DNA helicase n=1 Tax=Bifidobacterium tibiigranuli TaxID=2172043 RepID=UPI0026F23CC8|nr:UvrD-helicase domain-containing protein [Bifidobacterium tibiigranuli]MCI1650433.1 UvrD-helicase domain-containing protein [Bifidobacterium tibiigranuli]MCI2185144.1 UvrD-helicase domain-containing protein [Bifidobacterium tibiigranuli]MCI2203291.1 UvrD-helicase domain-containing protein [Bifidobacterium tibiigranuli]